MIAREAWPPILTAGVLGGFLIARFGVIWSLPVCLVLIFLVYLYKDPVRRVPAHPLAVVCPVDGRVMAVRTVRDRWLQRTALSVVVALARPGVTTLRSPSEGKVMDFWARAQDARAGEAGEETGRTEASPTCYAFWVQTDEEDDIVFAVHARRLLSRFKADVAPGERIGQGKRFGFIYFGTRIEVLVPENSRVDVTEGQNVLAGSGIIASLVHSKGAHSKGVHA